MFQNVYICITRETALVKDKDPIAYFREIQAPGKIEDCPGYSTGSVHAHRPAKTGDVHL